VILFGRGVRIWGLALLACALLTALSSVPLASAAPKLRFLGCVTGKLPINRTPRLPRPGWCVPTRSAVLDAEGSGLDHVQAVAASPDGRSVYAVSSREDSVAVFHARPLSLQECFTGNAKLRRHGRQPCKLFPHAGTEDALTGFNGVHFITVSPDGRSVYTVSGDDSIGTFTRNSSTGALTYTGCITGAIGHDSTGKTHVCARIPTATRVLEGADSGLSGPASLTVSPDSRFVYVAARGDAAVTTFARNPDGSLSYRGCLSGDTGGAQSACSLIADPAGNPTASILRSVNRIVISRDGTSLYASTPKSSSLAEFRRDPASGQLAYTGCITAEIGPNAGISATCSPIPTAVEAGFDSGMYLIDRLAISGDGRSLYGVAHGDNAVDSFSRDPATGALTYAGCITGDSALAQERGTGNPCTPVPGAQPRAVGSGLGEPGDLAISPNGRSLFVAVPKDSAVTRFIRNPATGALSFSECLTANQKAARPQGPCALASGQGGARQLGFAGLSSLTIAGGSLFAAASGQSAISRFAIGG
jgi:6-phosphogluconolactonase (cycloisomerase 2 family)